MAKSIPFRADGVPYFVDIDGNRLYTPVDHLPIPKDPSYLPPQIPFIEGSLYDNKGFLGYPERQGWTEEDLMRGHRIPRSEKEVHHFYQQ